MKNEKLAEQALLASEILRTGHPWEQWHISDQIWHLAEDDENPCHCAGNSTYKIRLSLATPDDGRPLHNPDNLTGEQVGAGWRLCVLNELDGRYKGSDVEIYFADCWRTAWAKDAIKVIPCGTNSAVTFRVPLSTPWPEAPKPEPAFTLPPPPPGMKWHREDGWEEGDLPQGWRPLVLGEKVSVGDEWKDCDNQSWQKRTEIFWEESDGANNRMHAQHRTKRPLTFTYADKKWTWHGPGNPMPCDGNRLVTPLVCYNGYYRTSGTLDGKNWEWNDSHIIGWRYAEPVMIPLGPDDCPPGSVVSFKLAKAPDKWWQCLSSADAGITVLGSSKSIVLICWRRLMDEFEINRSIPETGKWDKDAWVPCSKPQT